MLKTTISRNFDFHKLSKGMKTIMDAQPQKIAKESAKSIKQRILKGLKPPLKESTMKVRKARGVAGALPLVATGALMRSIKDTKKGLNIKQYGVYHHEGFTPKKIPFTQTLKKGAIPFINNKSGVKVPARPFISPGAKDLFKITKTIIKDMNSVLRSGGARRP